MKKILFLLTIFYLTNFLYHCSNNDDSKNKISDKQNDSNSVTITKVKIPDKHLDDKQKLLLIEQIPIGTSYSDIKAIFNNISELSAEHSIRNLFEAKAEVNILNYDAIIEFNFKNENVYSYYYQINELDKNIADTLYDYIQKFYSDNYGNYLEEKEAESSSYMNISSYWQLENFQVVMTNNIYQDYSILSWGFQGP